MMRVLPLAAILLMGGAATVRAQKVAYVASEAIFDRLPDMKAARAKLSEIQSSWMREIQRQEQEISKLRQEAETNRLLWSIQERRDSEAKLKDLEARLVEFRSTKFGPGGEYEKQHTELLSPLYEKVSQAVNDEAKAQKYDYVFDKSSRGLPMLYANVDYDITAAVLTRLGVKVDASELNPGAGAKDTPEDPSTIRRGRGRRDRESEPEEKPFDPNDALNPGGSAPPPPADDSDSGAGTEGTENP